MKLALILNHLRLLDAQNTVSATYTKKKLKISLKIYFVVCPIWPPIFSFSQLLNEPVLGAGINPGMALTPFSSSIG